MMERLGTSPAQEKLMREEWHRVRAQAANSQVDLAAARSELSSAIRSEVFDRAQFDAAAGRMDAAWQALRDSVAEALANIHNTLDSSQRTQLADWIATRGSHSAGPFR